MTLLQRAYRIRLELHEKTITAEEAKEKVEKLLDEIDDSLSSGHRSDAIATKTFIRQKLAGSLGLSNLLA